MRKAKYLSDVYAVSFLCPAIIFMLISVVGLWISANYSNNITIQDPSVISWIFFLVSISFLIISIVCKAFTVSQKRSDEELLSEGIILMAKVKAVQRQYIVTFSTHMPYRIHYTYILNGIECVGKSSLFWDKPKVQSGDKIEICTDMMGESTISNGCVIHTSDMSAKFLA